MRICGLERCDGSRNRKHGMSGPILGIETSCDETAAAVVVDGTRVCSSVVRTQVGLHAPYGGVVPEVASRAHLEWLPAVIRAAMDQAGLSGFDALEAVAATRGPGLAGALMVGYSAAKGLALRLNRPLVAVNHIEAHMLSAFLTPPPGRQQPDEPPIPPLQDCVPALALVVSGGHTLLYRVEDVGRYRLLGRTLDDAAGEAFDKGATLLGLGYPGGPALALEAAGAEPGAIRFPRGRPRPGNPALYGLRPECCWSFSGLKTALRTHLGSIGEPLDASAKAQIAADYQEAIVDALIRVCDRALTHEAWLLVGGGVAQNCRFRQRLNGWAQSRNVRLGLAPAAYCGDNAAMVAAVAGAGGGLSGKAAMRQDICPNLFEMD